MKTAKEIAIILKISERAVQYRFCNYGIIGKKRINTFFYSDDEIKRISFKRHKNITYPEMSNNNLYHNQVKVVELYKQLDNTSTSEISRILELSISICQRTIKLFKERNCLIIQSKL